MWDLETLRRMNGMRPDDKPLGPTTWGEFLREERTLRRRVDRVVRRIAGRVRGLLCRRAGRRS